MNHKSDLAEPTTDSDFRRDGSLWRERPLGRTGTVDDQAEIQLETPISRPESRTK